MLSWSVCTVLHCPLGKYLRFALKSPDPSSTLMQTLDQTNWQGMFKRFRVMYWTQPILFPLLILWLIQFLKNFPVYCDVLIWMRVSGNGHVCQHVYSSYIYIYNQNLIWIAVVWTDCGFIFGMRSLITSCSIRVWPWQFTERYVHTLLGQTTFWWQITFGILKKVTGRHNWPAVITDRSVMLPKTLFYPPTYYRPIMCTFTPSSTGTETQTNCFTSYSSQ